MALGEPKPSSQTTEGYRHILTDFFTGVSISVLGTTSISHDVQNAFYLRSADNSFYMSLLSTSFSFLPAPGLCLTSTNKTTRPSIQSSSLQPTGHSLCSHCPLSKISSLLLQGLWSILPSSSCPQASSKCTL